jgi:hypothetical protein
MNDIAFEEFDEVPFKVLPADFRDQWVEKIASGHDLQVAWVPFAKNILSKLSKTLHTKFTALWDKTTLGPEDRKFIDAINYSSLLKGSPYLEIHNKEIFQDAGYGFRIAKAYIDDGILEAGVKYPLVVIDENTTETISMGPVELKQYSGSQQFRLPKPVDRTHTFTVQIFPPKADQALDPDDPEGKY